jgi:hypothetical protein
MNRRRRPFIAALLLASVGCLFLAGIVRLFELRFSVGDVYPPYSTLRTDPLGAKAFYASLENLPGMQVERNLRPLHRLLAGTVSRPDGEAPAVFYLGVDPYEWPFFFTRQETERLEAILSQGGQVVMTFLPAPTLLTAQRLEKSRRDVRLEYEPDKSAKSSKRKEEDSKKGNSSPKKNDSEPERRNPSKAKANARPEDLALRWKLDFRRISQKDLSRTPLPPPVGAAVPVAPAAESAESASWHSALDFDLNSDAASAGWSTLYQRGGHPVIVARNFGAVGGRLILASDSYFLSNEALRAEPHPALLASLVGPARRLIFDETHFGITEDPGIMALARRFHLQGALAALGLLAGLFIWKSMASLVPFAAAENAGQPVVEPGRDSAAGFLNLLRRGVPARELLAVCLAQWQANAAGSRRHAPTPEVVKRLRVIVEEENAKPFHRRSPAQAYRAMCEALKRKG